jgi:hypothetical protein
MEGEAGNPGVANRLDEFREAGQLGLSDIAFTAANAAIGWRRWSSAKQLFPSRVCSSGRQTIRIMKNAFPTFHSCQMKHD